MHKNGVRTKLKNTISKLRVTGTCEKTLPYENLTREAVNEIGTKEKTHTAQEVA
jgi:hypothetical protein